MNSVVLDASFIIKLLIDEAGSTVAKAVFERYEESGYHLLAPGHAFAEVTEVLCRKRRRGAVTSQQLARALDFLARRIAVSSLDNLLEPAADLALSYRVSVYDALYVVLADETELMMLTCDLKLAAALRHSPDARSILGVDEGGVISYGEP